MVFPPNQSRPSNDHVPPPLPQRTYKGNSPRTKSSNNGRINHDRDSPDRFANKKSHTMRDNFHHKDFDNRKHHQTVVKDRNKKIAIPPSRNTIGPNKIQDLRNNQIENEYQISDDSDSPLPPPPEDDSNSCSEEVIYQDSLAKNLNTLNKYRTQHPEKKRIKTTVEEIASPRIPNRANSIRHSGHSNTRSSQDLMHAPVRNIHSSNTKIIGLDNLGISIGKAIKKNLCVILDDYEFIFYKEFRYSKTKMVHEKLMNYFKRLSRADTTLKYDYKELNSLNKYTKTKKAEMRDNINKNRHPAFIPYDFNSVKLYSSMQINGSPYINASYMLGMKNRIKCILAQAPLEETIEDFFEMIVENGTKKIFNFSSVETKYGRGVFWPEDDKIVFRAFGIKLISKKKLQNVIAYRVALFQKKNNQKFSFTIFHYTGWRNVRSYKFNRDIKMLIEIFNQTYHINTNGIPVICCDTGTNTAPLFYAALMVEDQYRRYGEIDINLTARFIRLQRRFAMPEFRDYLALHSIIGGMVILYDKEIPDDEDLIYSLE